MHRKISIIILFTALTNIKVQESAYLINIKQTRFY